jgi:hypothetical protein
LWNGCFWRKAVIGRSPNVGQVQQETRTRRSIGSHMSQSAPENLRELVKVCPLERHVRSSTDIVRPPRHVRFVPICDIACMLRLKEKPPEGGSQI